MIVDSVSLALEDIVRSGPADSARSISGPLARIVLLETKNRVYLGGELVVNVLSAAGLALLSCRLEVLACSNEADTLVHVHSAAGVEETSASSSFSLVEVNSLLGDERFDDPIVPVSVISLLVKLVIIEFVGVQGVRLVSSLGKFLFRI